MPSITTSIRLELIDVDSTSDALLREQLMRPQQAAMRLAYNRLLEGIETKEIWQGLRQIFPLLTGRNLNDAITLASGTLESQRELLPDRIVNLQQRLERAHRNLERETKRKAGSRVERIKAIQVLILRLTQEHQALQRHLENGTVPPAMFGQRRTWRRLPGSLVEWRERRCRQFYSRGNTQLSGNPHCQLEVGEGGRLQISIRVPTAPKRRGQKLTSEAIWLTFSVSYSRQYDRVLRLTALEGKAKIGCYDVRLIRLGTGTYRAYVTIAEPVKGLEYGLKSPLPAFVEVAGGVDLNLDHLALVITDPQGQYRRHKIFTYPNLGELRREKTEWLIGNLARDVIRWLKAQGGQALVIENLDLDNQGSGSAAYNRRTVPFAHRQLAQALVRRALREGVIVKRVNPAYTSWIGQLKYAPQYGINRHVAAAHVIGRRGFGLQERLPKALIAKFPAIVILVRANLERLSQLPQKSKEVLRQIRTRREWLRRLEHYEDYLPEKGRPWLLWVTLYLIEQTISEVRGGLLLKEEYRWKEASTLSAS